MDLYGAAVDEVASQKARDLHRLCELARASASLQDFEARFADGGNASASVRTIKGDVQSVIENVTGSQCSPAGLKDFLAHFVLIKFDFLHEGQTDLPNILNSLRACLAAPENEHITALWDRLCSLSQENRGRAGVFDRPMLVRSLSAAFRLAAGPTFVNDLARIRGLTQQWLADIEDDVEGTRLDRAGALSEVEAKLQSHRWVQLTGLPGVGKSVLLRRSSEIDLTHGPVLLLKSDRLEGTGWASFATANGLSNTSLPELLVELASAGSNTLYIDGIDRIEKRHRPVVLDIVREVMGNELLDSWRILVTLRDSGIEQLRNWLGNVLNVTTVGNVEIKGLDDDEAGFLAREKPLLRPLLFGSKNVREIVRRPFFAKILSQNYNSDGDSTFQPQSEIDLISNWWIRGGYDVDCQNVLVRQRAIIELGHYQARNLNKNVHVNELNPSTVGLIEQLVSDGILRWIEAGSTLRFTHDIFFEWAFFKALDDVEDWLAILRECGERPAFARVVELLSQSEFRPDGNWAGMLTKIESSGMRPQWTRAWVLAPPGIPSFHELMATYKATLDSGSHKYLEKTLVWFQAEKTIPNSTFLDSDLPQRERIRNADSFAWPSDIRTWSNFIWFLLRKMPDIPIRLYPDVVSIFDVWQNACFNIKNPVSDALLELSATWLKELTEEKSSRRPPRTTSRWSVLETAHGDFWRSLVILVLRSAETRPDITSHYLSQIIGIDTHHKREMVEDIFLFSPIQARTHPDLLVDVSLDYLRQELQNLYKTGSNGNMNRAANAESWRSQFRQKSAPKRRSSPLKAYFQLWCHTLSVTMILNDWR